MCTEHSHTATPFNISIAGFSEDFRKVRILGNFVFWCIQYSLGHMWACCIRTHCAVCFQRSEYEIPPHVEEFLISPYDRCKEIVYVENKLQIRFCGVESSQHFAKLVVCVHQSGEEILPLDVCSTRQSNRMGTQVSRYNVMTCNVMWLWTVEGGA